MSFRIKSLSSDTVISVEGLGKRYTLGSRSDERYTALRDVISRKAKSLLRLEKPSKTPAATDFWALKDVSFEVKQGEVLGIIGRNGAGKSTLLKILSRITEPTEGRIRIKGRVASLLEVGTGFHPELTGRENIFLNGAILGMHRSEIKAKFDEIVAFAEVEKFLDTPVKRYSSGMYVRLAFAVAAHLEPEILIVDEVLAVGDAEFQKKCLGKMEVVAKGGRTVLFVSHHLPSVQRLCNQGVFLNAGKLVTTGTVEHVIERYMSERTTILPDKLELSSKQPQILSWALVATKSQGSHACLSRQQATFTLKIHSPHVIPEAQVGFIIRSLDGQILISANSLDNDGKFFPLKIGINSIHASVQLVLRAGLYKVDIALADNGLTMLDQLVVDPPLTVLPCDRTVLDDKWKGIINEPVIFSLGEDEIA